MAQDWARRFYNGKQWRGCITAYIAKRRLIDGGLCEVFHDEQGYIVHHKTILTCYIGIVKIYKCSPPPFFEGLP